MTCMQQNELIKNGTSPGCALDFNSLGLINATDQMPCQLNFSTITTNFIIKVLLNQN